MCSFITLSVYFLLGLFALFALASVVWNEIQGHKMREYYKKETKRFNDVMISLAKKSKKSNELDRLVTKKGDTYVLYDCGGTCEIYLNGRMSSLHSDIDLGKQRMASYRKRFGEKK